MFFSRLKKGWMAGVGLSSKDTRKRVYKLKSPNDAIKEMVK